MGTDPRKVALGAALLLAGCTVGPNYKAPETQSPASWFDFTAPAATTEEAPAASIAVTAPVEAAWWHVFSDPELESLEQRAAKANLNIQTAAQQLEQSRQQANTVFAARYPNLNGNASYVREKASDEGLFSALGNVSPTGANGATNSAGLANGNGGIAGGVPGALFNPFNLLSYGLDASWELDFWGNVRRQAENANAQVQASTEAQRNALVSVLAEIARDYVQLRGIQRDLAITRENLRIDNDSLRLTQDRFRGGLTTQLDVENAQTQAANVAAQIPSLEQQEEAAINAISLLLAEPPQALRGELIQPKAVPPVPPTVPVGLPSELLRRRPDILQAEAQLHAATANVGVAVAAFYPQITISGSFSLQALQVSNLGNWAARQYAFGPSITLPIFEGGRLRAQLRLSQAQQKAAAIAYRSTVLGAWHEVANSLDAYEAEQRRRAQLEIAVRSGRAATALAQQRYTQGIADFLNVLTAQANQLSAERQLADSTAAVSTDLVAIYKALGGGWDAPGMADAGAPLATVEAAR